MFKCPYRKFYRVTLVSLIVGLQTILGASIISAAPTPSVKLSSFQKLVTFFQRKPPKLPRTVRGIDEICLISPGLIGPRMATWHRRPLFIWQGEGKSIVVKSTKSTDLSWTAAIVEGMSSLSYSSSQPDLELGHTYSWQIANTKSVPQFSILKDDEWQPVTAGLTAIEQTMKGQSAEGIALAKAEFFAEKDLWSDALQVLYEVEKPSAAFVEARRSYMQDICKPASPPATEVRANGVQVPSGLRIES